MGVDGVIFLGWVRGAPGGEGGEVQGRVVWRVLVFMKVEVWRVGCFMKWMLDRSALEDSFPSCCCVDETSSMFRDLPHVPFSIA